MENVLLSKLEPVNKDKNAIVFCIDENCVKYFGVALQSFIEHANSENIYDLVVLHKNVCENSQKKLKSMLPSNVSLRFYNIESAKEAYFKNIILEVKNYWSESIYYRLLIPMIFSNYEKVLYCDSDIVYDRSVDSIFSISPDGKAIFAVLDSITQELLYYKKRNNYMIDYLKINPKKYFNSGVILYNIKNINLNNYKLKLCNIFNTLENLLFPDQDILNIIFENNVKFLSLKYNFQLNIPIYQISHFNSYEKEFMDDYVVSEKEPIIIHFSITEKPWDFPAILSFEKFWFYARKSPFYEEIIYNTFNNRILLLANKNKIILEYCLAKILALVTFGKLRTEFKTKRNLLKNKVRELRKFL